METGLEKVKLNRDGRIKFNKYIIIYTVHSSCFNSARIYVKNYKGTKLHFFLSPFTFALTKLKIIIRH